MRSLQATVTEERIKYICLDKCYFIFHENIFLVLHTQIKAFDFHLYHLKSEYS